MASSACLPPRAVTPAATYISSAPTTVSKIPTIVKSTDLRIPRSVQLRLARSVTFGVLGDDSQLYPSSKWKTENMTRFQGTNGQDPREKPDFVITSLDTRKHNPQSKNIFHITRINKKPVCNVTSWDTGDSPADKGGDSDTVYMTSYRDTERVPHHLVRANDGKKPTEGIVPVNEIGSTMDVRGEMMLPVCDSTVIPSAHNPHRYLLRKRKVPPPYRIWGTDTTHHYGCGVVYPNLEKPRMASYSPGQVQTGELPFQNEKMPAGPSADNDRVSVSSLSGMDFSRRKYIQPPMGHILGSFKGGVQETKSVRFDDRMLPFMRAKTII